MSPLPLREQVGYLAFRFDDTHPAPRRRRDYLDLADEILLVLALQDNRTELAELIDTSHARIACIT